MALLVVLAWPPDTGRSLLTVIVNKAADPTGALPLLPEPLPMGMDDDGDAVTAHDMEEQAYFAARERSAFARVRIDLKNADDPFAPTRQRQVLAVIAVVGALLVWRMGGARA